jgi:hypothetical protein
MIEKLPPTMGALCSPLPVSTLALPVSGVIVMRCGKPALVKHCTLTKVFNGRKNATMFGIIKSFMFESPFVGLGTRVEPGGFVAIDRHVSRGRH